MRYKFISSCDSLYFTKNKIYEVVGFNEKSQPIVKGDTGRVHVVWVYGKSDWERVYEKNTPKSLGVTGDDL